MTKKCPYCFEDVQVEALKCKHCGEWFTKQDPGIVSSAKKTVGTALNFIAGKIDQHQQKRYSHLYIPTSEKPLTVEGVNFFDTHFASGDRKIYYSQIASIFFSANRTSYNGILQDTDSKLKLFIDLKLDGVEQIDPTRHQYVVTLEVSTGLLSAGNKKDRERITFLYDILSKATFQNRLLRYFSSLKTYGYFIYPPNVKIFGNGDVEKKGRKENIGRAIKNELLVYGNYKLSGRNSYSDPFHFAIYKTHGVNLAIAFFELANKLSFEVHYDKDVFDGLLGYYMKNGCFID